MSLRHIERIEPYTFTPDSVVELGSNDKLEPTKYQRAAKIDYDASTHRSCLC